MNKFITILAFAFCCLKITAQPHVFFSKTAQLSYMKTTTGQGIQADLLNITKAGFMHRFSLAYDMGEVGKATTKYQIAKVDFAMIHSIWSHELTFVNIGWGCFISRESLSNKLLSQSDTQISPGITLLLEFEIYFNKFGLFMVGEQRYRPMSLIGDWEWRAGAGLKYVFK